MNFLKTLRNKYRYWKAFQKYPKGVRERGFLPSETYCKYAPSEKFNGKRVLNLGCGTSVYKTPNVVNLDGWQGDGVNIVWDLSKTPLPFADQEFDLIIANHVMEHIPDWFECFKEMTRICKVGGKIEIWVPPVSSDSAFTYRDHINRIGLHSFYGCKTFPMPGCNLWADEERKRVGNVSNVWIANVAQRPIIKWWAMLAPQCVLDFMMDHMRNMVSEIGFTFIKESHSNG
jgi:SAM-dependent methyltransferase